MFVSVARFTASPITDKDISTRMFITSGFFYKEARSERRNVTSFKLWTHDLGVCVLETYWKS